ncbi:hypothetical protein [Thermoflavimicrobium dichotomicum]|uniref:Uncharacterized protein n=1 Tax=Thermoflavimicrobium dichotomicum TaxID=46223 RepID=A0A1I3JL79_9BACL|nr:hypothetical protein [Thermoflavimicrobium dichotomicum]SFI61013.1 hypothetical protein SAMN05421852_101114 [Thermoflavimicrobium dichotomicum]
MSTTHRFIIYRVVQEALTNAKRHGEATQADVFVSVTDQELVIIRKNSCLNWLLMVIDRCTKDEKGLMYSEILYFF